MAFFEVSDRSFHQVAEVLSQTKSRLSINGWFHGKINKRPIAHLDPVPETKDIKEIEVIQICLVFILGFDSYILILYKGYFVF